MKVISWNLKNISANKLNNQLKAAFRANGLGNNVLDYIVNVVLGNAQWEEVISDVPADLFVIIELKTGGNTKGGAVSGNCIPTLTALTNALNTGLGNRPDVDPNDYHYSYAVPLVSGPHETAGFIYNDRVFSFNAMAAQRDLITNTYLTGRTPLVCTLNRLGHMGQTMRFSAIHDPPPQGAANVRFKPPISYCRRLVNTAAAAVQNTFFLGDFNCQPTDYYVSQGIRIFPFTNLPNFRTDLANDSLSSVRKRIVNANPDPASYLNAAYDNCLYWVTNANPRIVVQDEYIPDLIGEAKDMNFDPPANYFPNHRQATLNAYNTVSDHLPIIIEMTVI